MRAASIPLSCSLLVVVLQACGSDGFGRPSLWDLDGDGIDNNCDDSAAPCAPHGNVDASASPLRIAGADEDQHVGYAVAFVPDLDGDGDDELLVGAPGMDDLDTAEGAALLFLGPIEGPTTVADAAAVLRGEDRNDQAGSRLSPAGDVDGDGEDDLLVLCEDYGEYGGHLHLAFGPFAGEIDLGEVRMHGNNYDYGEAVAGDVDFNEDGYADFVFGAGGWDEDGEMYDSDGAAWIYYGPAPETGYTSYYAPAGVLGDVGEYEMLGTAVAAGDLDGDGRDDLVVGGDRWGDDLGAVWFVYEMPADRVEAADLADARHGSAKGGRAGSELAFVGDMDGDGHPEVAVGAPGVALAGDGEGAVYVLSGAQTGEGDLADAAAVLLAPSGARDVGRALSSGGDVDGDGRAELLVGGDIELDRTWLYYGPLAGGGSLEDADLVIRGEQLTNFGLAVAGGGDLDGDGFDELALPAWSADVGDVENAGIVYLLVGGGL